MLYLILFFIVFAIALTVIYIIHRFKNLSYLKNMKESNNSTYRMTISVFCIALALALFIDFINTIIILLHFVLISLFVDLILKLFKKFTYDIKTLVAIVLTIVYLSYGFFAAYDVKKTTYNLTTNKNVSDIKIAQISDVHLGTTFDGKGFKNYVIEIEKQKPDLIVITGDFVDDDSTKKDLKIALESLKNVKTKYGVYYVFGNHDKGLMGTRDFDEKELRNEMEKNNIRILEDTTIELDDIIIVGRQDRSVSNRAPAYSLISNLNKDKYIVVLDHQPNDFDALSKTDADLVLSGHTHGGQMLPVGYIGLMIHANDKIYGLETRKNTNFIVSSGISTWAASFKTGAISEYVIINIKKSK